MKCLGETNDHILIYAKNKQLWRHNLLPRTEEMNNRYKNIDSDPRGDWTSSDLSVKTYNSNCDYEIILPSGRIVKPPASRCWSVNKEKFNELVADNRIWFGKDGNNVPTLKRFLTEVKQGITAMTVWSYEEVGHNTEAKKEVKTFNSNDVFATPKPERLIQKILTLATNEGDLVLDSFLGSGTTAAVCQKLNRKYIGIELGQHCYTHVIPRLKAVIDGEQGGISKSVNWQGGGGYKFYELAPSLLNKDMFGNFIISPDYNIEMLAAAMALHKGYTYSPDSNYYFKQGHRNDTNFIFTTTSFLTIEYIDKIHSDMKENEHLLICAKSYQKECENRYKNIIVQKIPDILLGRCEFDKNNYDLNIILQDIE